MHGMIIVSFLTAKLYHYDADCAIKSTLCIIAYFSLYLKHYFYDERRFYVFFKLHAKRFLLSTALIPSLALTTTVKVHAASNTEDAFDNAANTFFWDIMDSSPINLHYSFSFPEDYKPSDNPPLGSFSETFTETAEILNRAKENLS